MRAPTAYFAIAAIAVSHAAALTLAAMLALQGIPLSL